MLPSRRVRAMVVLLAAAALFLVTADAALAHPKVRVMTRNMYVGANLAPLLTAPTADALAARASEAFLRVQASDPPARIVAMAREIADADADIVGLQEVALIETDTPSDGALTPAGTPVFDFLEMLLAALADRGAAYSVVTEAVNGSNEIPTTLGFDVRLTDRDVLLARAGDDRDELSWRNAASANFATNLAVPTPLGPLTVLRGFNVADFAADGSRFRVVNTHLEAFSDAIRAVQAGELLKGALGNAAQSQILLGDINSGPGANAAVYAEFLGAGFADSWVTANRRSPGLTCCFAELLLDPDASVFHSRIDVVLTRQVDRSADRARVVGTDPESRTPSGRWPSDHAGVTARIRP